MSDSTRVAVAFGFAASLLAATSALALDASRNATDPSQSSDASHAVELVSGGVAAKAADDPNCPNVTLAPDGDTVKSGGASSTLEGLARDCANLGAETIVKVALVGESQRKKGGDATGFDAPMTIQIRDGEGHDVETRKVNLRVEMAEGVQRVSFQHVEENVSLPPPSSTGYANWTIVVGLDPAVPGAREVASNEDEVGAADERPAKAVRSAKSKRSKSARAGAYRRASRVARVQRSAPPQAAARAVAPDGVRQPTVPSAPAPGFAANATTSPRQKAATSSAPRRGAAQQQSRLQPAEPRRAQTAARAPSPPPVRSAQNSASPVEN